MLQLCYFSGFVAICGLLLQPASCKSLKGCNPPQGTTELFRLAKSQGVNRQFSRAELCFCAMTGQCLDQSLCVGMGGNATACQTRVCGGNGTALESTQYTASFYNYRDHGDILTIPHQYFSDLSKLVEDTTVRLSLIQKLLEAGRRAFTTFLKKQPELQCFHLSSCISVKWLHLHTFIGRVPSEGLPGTNSSALCVFGNQSVTSAAQQVILNTNPGGCVPNLIAELTAPTAAH